MARSRDLPNFGSLSFRSKSLKSTDVFSFPSHISTMSQHRAISQLLSLGQESFEDEIRRLVSI